MWRHVATAFEDEYRVVLASQLTPTRGGGQPCRRTGTDSTPYTIDLAW
jgi:hypothetical protein